MPRVMLELFDETTLWDQGAPASAILNVISTLIATVTSAGRLGSKGAAL